MLNLTFYLEVLFVSQSVYFRDRTTHYERKQGDIPSAEFSQEKDNTTQTEVVSPGQIFYSEVRMNFSLEMMDLKK